MSKYLFFLGLVIVAGSITFFSFFNPSIPQRITQVQAQSSVLHWPMPGHDVRRTSWATEGEMTVTFQKPLVPLWHKKISPYIPSKAQLVTVPSSASHPDLILVPTVKGVYAFNADAQNVTATDKHNNDAEYWFYPTDMPVGHSPSIVNDIAYFGSYDRTIHAVNVANGQKVWQSVQVGAGFDTNPLVVNNRVYAGNRDGYFYAFDANNGELLWYFKTDGPISYSAAYDQPTNTIYFASNDSHFYALDATSGTQKWKSAKLPGDGFYSWWPVISGNYVLFTGTNIYNAKGLVGIDASREGLDAEAFENTSVYNNCTANPKTVDTCIANGSLLDCVVPVGQSTASCTITNPPRVIDGQIAEDYIAQYPERRSLYVFTKTTGMEYQYAPILWNGNGSGNRLPPAIDSNGLVYLFTPISFNPNYLGLKVSAWEIGTNNIRPVSAEEGDSLDENRIAIGIGVINPIMIRHHKEDQGAEALNVVTGVRTVIYTVPNILGLTPPVTPPVSSELLSTFGRYYGDWDERKYGNISRNGTGTNGNVNPFVPIRDKVCANVSNAIVCYETSN
ncbi:PQQ-like beta-propeller repeat protein [Candidatus Roizmanbacteria bacterium]|nr:PQQ-like beta-propeller repeat protein [Candidatus Roizmanbacteria bacterium]